MRQFVTFLALLCLTNSVCLAQRTRNRHTKKENVTVESLISDYRFREASEKLQKDISNATRRRRPTDQLEEQLERVRSLEVMLSATEKVHFVDSMVVDKNAFLNAYHLGSDCGQLVAVKELFPEDVLKNINHGEVAYCNELNDKIYFSKQEDSGLSGMYVSERIGDVWGKEEPLKGVAAEGAVQDYPYVLSDGVTLYYSDKNPEGLGGYDIYVTRYSSDNGTFLKPENIGMPFNSMANDYMYAIDEMNNLGWFVTDRNQPEDKVCVYIFQPNVTREVYNPVAVGEEAMVRYAKISSMKESILNEVSLAKAKERLQQIISKPSSREFGEKVHYIINDRTVYTSLLDFKNKEAQNIAMEWAKEFSRLQKAESRLNQMRQDYNKETATKEDVANVLQQENLVNNLRQRVNILAKNMRMVELK